MPLSTRLVVLLYVLLGVEGLSYNLVKDWPHGNQATGELPFPVGQVSGVAVTPDDSEVVLFHRADRQWDGRTFDFSNVVRESYQVPISKNTLIWLDNKSGKVKKQGGKNLFYLPHGITVCTKGFIWITDVGSHQMYKLSPDLRVLMTIGVKFQPGSDDKHFCKPTDVAVQNDGNFFVGDGYCNSRVMEFDEKGNVVKIISPNKPPNIGLLPAPGNMFIVHSVSLDHTNNLLYVADRENGRVLVFDAVTGRYKSQIKPPNGGAVYTVRYNKDKGGVVHLVTGPKGVVQRGKGYTFSVKDNTFTSSWPKGGGFSLAHAMAVSGDNKELFVVEIHPNRAWKFTKASKTTREDDELFVDDILSSLHRIIRGRSFTQMDAH